jgi:hypothetical protein
VRDDLAREAYSSPCARDHRRRRRSAARQWDGASLKSEAFAAIFASAQAEGSAIAGEWARRRRFVTPHPRDDSNSGGRHDARWDLI